MHNKSYINILYTCTQYIISTMQYCHSFWNRYKPNNTTSNYRYEYEITELWAHPANWLFTWLYADADWAAGWIGCEWYLETGCFTCVYVRHAWKQAVLTCVHERGNHARAVQKWTEVLCMCEHDGMPQLSKRVGFTGMSGRRVNVEHHNMPI